jgi:hypothetical protein
MNIFLWILQALLALHTAMGAFWKLSHNAEETMPSLKALQPAWMGMAALEGLCALVLLLAFLKPLGKLAPAAAALIALEMLVMSGVHLKSGAAGYGPLGYWLTVAVLAGFLAYARVALRPL